MNDHDFFSVVEWFIVRFVLTTLMVAGAITVLGPPIRSVARFFRSLFRERKLPQGDRSPIRGEHDSQERRGVRNATNRGAARRGEKAPAAAR